MLGTHNTMTYLHPQWWLRPFAWMARCQRKNIVEQIKAGVWCFDLRVTLHNGAWVFAHGMARYEGETLGDILDFISMMYCMDINKQQRPVVRILLEKGDDKVRKAFIHDCAYWQECHPSIIFTCGRYKPTWEKLYDFRDDPYTDADFDQSAVSSMAEDARWYERIWPRAFWRRCGRWKHHRNDVSITLQDFV